MRYYFKVKAKCGHVGREFYIPINFPVKATNGVEAARIVRQHPRVKHDHLDAILSVVRINSAEFFELIEINNNDPYLQCHSIQEQRFLCQLEDRKVRENRTEIDIYDSKEKRKQRVEYKQKKMRTSMVPIEYEEE